MRPKLRLFIPWTVLILMVFGGGYVFGLKTGQETPKTVTVRGVSGLEDQKPQDVDFGVFWQAWDLLDKDYLRHEEAATQDKVYGAVRGLVQSLNDPYTQYFTPADNTRFQQDVQGSFGGIGAELGVRNGRLLIISPLKGSPASRAGLAAGDQIVKINSTSTENMQVDEAVNLIRGQENSTVTLSIYRESWGKVKEFPLKREKINLPTIDSEIINGNILYIHLYSFNGNAGEMMAKELESQFKKQPIGGIVLDLRDNPGGYLEVAVDLASWFLPEGTLVVTEQGLAEEQEFKARGNSVLQKVPLVVLINKGSASASEILAGALRDHKRAELVGEQSFGKGTVQELRALRGGSAIKMTIAHWVLPNGQILEGNGLKPDYSVSMPDESSTTSTTKIKDPQLEKAKEILKSKISTLFQSS